MTEVSCNEPDVSDMKEDTELQCSVENSDNEIVLSSQITKIEKTKNGNEIEELEEIETPNDQIENGFSDSEVPHIKKITETTSHTENGDVKNEDSADVNTELPIMSEVLDSNGDLEETSVKTDNTVESANLDHEIEIAESCKSSKEEINTDMPTVSEIADTNGESIKTDATETEDQETEIPESLETIESNDTNPEVENEIPQKELVAEGILDFEIPEEPPETDMDSTTTTLPDNEEICKKPDPPPFFALEITTVVSLKDNSMIFDELGLGDLTHDDLTQDSDENATYENQDKVGDENIEKENEEGVEENENDIENQDDSEEKDNAEETEPPVEEELVEKTDKVKIKVEKQENTDGRMVKIVNFVEKIKTESEIKAEPEPEHDPEDLLVEIDTSIKKKGRPRKSKKFYEIIETPIENGNSSEIKQDPDVPRRRGRPRRPEVHIDTSVTEELRNKEEEEEEVETSEIKEETNDSGSIPAKRKLGRPRKSEMDAKRHCSDVEVNIAERIMLRERRSNQSMNSFDETSQDASTQSDGDHDSDEMFVESKPHNFSFNYKSKPSKRGRPVKFKKSRGRPRRDLDEYIQYPLHTPPTLYPRRGRPRKCENIGRSYSATATSGQTSRDVVEIEDSDEEIVNINEPPSDSVNDPDNLLVELEVPISKRGRGRAKASTPKQNDSYFATNSYTSNDDPYYDNGNEELDDYEDDDDNDQDDDDDQDDNPQLVYSYKTNSFVPISEASQSQRKQNKMRRKNAKYLMRKDPILPQCEHQRDSLFRCAEVSDLNARYFSDLYYRNNDRDAQNAFLLKYVKHCYKRKKGRFYTDNDKYIPIEYHVKLKTQDIVKVCQRTFLDLLQVPRCRIVQILRANNEALALEAKVSATTPPPLVPISRRGGDRRGPGYDKKRESVINFITQFKDPNDFSEKPKIYLSCTIKDLCSVYNSQAEPANQVLYGYFRGIIISFFEVTYVNPQNEVGLNSSEVIDLADDDDDDGEDYNDQNDYSYNDQVQNEYEQQMEDDAEIEDVGGYGETFQPKLLEHIGISNLPESILGD